MKRVITLQLLEVPKWEGSGEPSQDCGEACQLDNELLIGDDLVWRETSFSDCSATCGTGKVFRILDYFTVSHDYRSISF